MKTPALILLLLMMLAPRLSAAPHAFVCAPAMAQASAVSEASAHHHGDGAASQPDSQHPQAEPALSHSHHHGASVDSAETATDSVSNAITDAVASAADASSNNTGDDCKHCQQCEQHCSAVIPVELPRQLTQHSREPLLTLTPAVLAGFASSLNRPPRTSSI